MIIEYFLFCLSFPLFVSVFAANKKGLLAQSLERDRICKFLFCLVHARHFFASERQQILDDYFLFWEMS